MVSGQRKPGLRASVSRLTTPRSGKRACSRAASASVRGDRDHARARAKRGLDRLVADGVCATRVDGRGPPATDAPQYTSTPSWGRRSARAQHLARARSSPPCPGTRACSRWWPRRTRAGRPAPADRSCGRRDRARPRRPPRRRPRPRSPRAPSRRSPRPRPATRPAPARSTGTAVKTPFSSGIVRFTWAAAPRARMSAPLSSVETSPVTRAPRSTAQATA